MSAPEDQQEDTTVFIQVTVVPSGPGAALPEGHFRPGQRALLVRGVSGRGHAPPAAPPLRAAARLPGRRPAAARQRLQLPPGAAAAKRPAGGGGSVRDGRRFRRRSSNHSIYSQAQSDQSKLSVWKPTHWRVRARQSHDSTL